MACQSIRSGSRTQQGPNQLGRSMHSDSASCIPGLAYSDQPAYGATVTSIALKIDQHVDLPAVWVKPHLNINLKGAVNGVGLDLVPQSLQQSKQIKWVELCLFTVLVDHGFNALNALLQYSR